MYNCLHGLEAQRRQPARRVNIMIRLVDTYRGKRKIDVTAGIVESNEKVMVPFSGIKLHMIDGVPHFVYLTSANGGVALTAKGHRAANEPTEEEKEISVKNTRIAAVMSEGYESYNQSEL